MVKMGVECQWGIMILTLTSLGQTLDFDHFKSELHVLTSLTIFMTGGYI